MKQSNLSIKTLRESLPLPTLHSFLPELKYNSSLCLFFGGKYIVFENNIQMDNNITENASNVFNVFIVIVLIY